MLIRIAGALCIAVDWDASVGASALATSSYLLGGLAVFTGLVEVVRKRRIRPVLSLVGTGLAATLMVPFFWWFLLIMVAVGLLAAAVGGAS